MRVIHLLRKYNPAEWGGTETALQRLFDGLRRLGVAPVMYCPRLEGAAPELPAETAWPVRRFRACVPVYGMSPQQKRRFIAVGGNLMSFDLLPALWRERDVALIHTHTLGRLGSIAAAVARVRRLPLVVTLHGGLAKPARAVAASRAAGFDWGRFFGMLLQSRRLLHKADALLACNPAEAAELRREYPNQRVQVQPHSVPAALFKPDHRETARAAFPQIQGRRVLLCAGRIDPVKNQGWLVARAPEIFQKHPDTMLVLAGACTDDPYGNTLQRHIRQLGLENRILLTGGLPPGDPRLVGLFQEAQAVILPSVSETFGLVLLEAWAAGTSVISSRTPGATALVKDGENGWLFDLERPHSFHDALDWTLNDPGLRAQLAAAGHKLATTEYSVAAVARRMKKLYEELIEEKHALRHPA